MVPMSRRGRPLLSWQLGCSVPASGKDRESQGSPGSQCGNDTGREGSLQCPGLVADHLLSPATQDAEMGDSEELGTLPNITVTTHELQMASCVS